MNMKNLYAFINMNIAQLSILLSPSIDNLGPR
jgi:hypothetical protein